MKPYYVDSTVTLYHGKNVSVLSHLDAGSVDCVVTSPPYFGLRSYLPEDHPDKADEYGTEETPAEFIANLVATFREVRRVLADDGTFWLNLGDSYAQSGKSGPQGSSGQRAGRTFTAAGAGSSGGLAPKNLMLMPHRVAMALQDDSWILRNAICWEKPNAMPESVTDRLSTRYELLFLFSKSRKYWFDLDAVRADYSTKTIRTYPTAYAPDQGAGTNGQGASSLRLADNPLGRNPGDVWEIPTQPFPGAHFAAYPPELVRRCIVAGCKPGGTVLDPFHGSGTTGMVAQKQGRKYVGIELNREYLDLSLRTRLADGVLDFGADS